MSTPAYMRMRVPEFASESDETLQFWIDEAIESIAPPDCWSSNYKLALVYLAAHELKSAREQTDAGTGLMAGEGLVGRVQSVKTLDWSVSMANQGTADDVGDEELMSTIWGQKFIRIRDTQVVDLSYSYRNR